MRDQAIWILTKGDANDEPDPAAMPATDVIGRRGTRCRAPATSSPCCRPHPGSCWCSRRRAAAGPRLVARRPRAGPATGAQRCGRDRRDGRAADAAVGAKPAPGPAGDQSTQTRSGTTADTDADDRARRTGGQPPDELRRAGRLHQAVHEDGLARHGHARPAHVAGRDRWIVGQPRLGGHARHLRHRLRPVPRGDQRRDATLISTVTPRSAASTTDNPGAGTLVVRAAVAVPGMDERGEQPGVGDRVNRTDHDLEAPCTTTSADITGAGDNNGYESNAANACADNRRTRSRTRAAPGAASCGTGATPDAAKDRHRFWGFATGLPGSVTSIDGIQVRVDPAWTTTAARPNLRPARRGTAERRWTTIKTSRCRAGTGRPTRPGRRRTRGARRGPAGSSRRRCSGSGSSMPRRWRTSSSSSTAMSPARIMDHPEAEPSSRLSGPPSARRAGSGASATADCRRRRS